MLRRIFTFSIFFLCLIALILYFMGVRSINLYNGGNWLRTIATRFSQLDGVRIPQIPEWVLVTNPDPAWYEYIAVAIEWIVNFFTGLYNVVISLVNFVIDILKFVSCLIWVMFDSPLILAS